VHLPIMENLVEPVHESSSASVLDDTDIIYVLRIPTHKIMAISLGVGSRLPAYCTSMGRVLLAGLEDGAVEAILKRSDLKAHTSRTVTRRAQLLERVQEVRARGWSLVNQELEEGLVSNSAPIRDRTGRTVAALNVSGQANRTPAAQVLKLFLPPLRAAANQISALLPRR
jgi:IclR family pca regulon transcriptional regulator